MKKVGILILSFVFVSLLIVLPVFAADKTKNITLSSSEIVNHDYFAAGDTVHVSGTVNGDAYVGGGTIIVDGTINGDLIAGGGNITIAGNIQGDVRAGGGNITITRATVGGNITAGGGNVTIDKTSNIQGSLVAGGGNVQILAPISKGATIGGGTVLVDNSINGNVLAGVGQLTLSQNAKILGDLTYWSENKADIANGATVSGTTKQEIPREKDQMRAYNVGKNVSSGIAGFFVALKFLDVVLLLIIGIVFIHFLPNFTIRTSDYVRTRLGWALLIGLITFILLPVVGIILFVTILGIPIALTLFITFFISVWIGRIFAIYAIGRFIMSKTSNKKAKTLAYVTGLIVYFILNIIPIVNFLTDLAVVLAGVGALLATKREYYLDLRKKNLL